MKTKRDCPLCQKKRKKFFQRKIDRIVRIDFQIIPRTMEIGHLLYRSRI